MKYSKVKKAFAKLIKKLSKSYPDKTGFETRYINPAGFSYSYQQYIVA